MDDIEFRFACYQLASQILSGSQNSMSHEKIALMADKINTYVSHPITSATSLDLQNAEQNFEHFCKTVSTRISHVLSKNGIATFSNLYKTGENGLLRCPNFGSRSMDEINSALKAFGMAEVPRWGKST